MIRSKPSIMDFFRNILPGFALCCLVSAMAFGFEKIEVLLFHQAWFESLVIAILLGTLIRTFVKLPKVFNPGIGFSAKTLLEVAVVLLGAGISIGAVVHAGYGLLISIAVIVFITIIASYSIGRILKLPSKLALLVACGNSICGNSAIAAAAPVIKANGEDVASSIAFTAVLGIIVILVLPSFMPLLGLSFTQYGVLAGMTVYAVPQVLAAAAPISLISVQTATLVKLIRVLMLGPMISVLALIYGRESRNRLSLSRLVPWFILGFMGLMLARSFGMIPDGALLPINHIANTLTIISMAALGLGVDLRSVLKAGTRVIATAVCSLLLLGGLSLMMIYVLALP